MYRRKGPLRAFVASVTMVTAMVLASTSIVGSPASAGTTSTSGPYLYVANRGRSSVTAYRRDSSGAVHPVRTIAGSRTGLVDPWAVAFARAGDLYVQDYLSPARTALFPPTAYGDNAPRRTFASADGNRDSPSIAVDPAGYVYVSRFQPPSTIEVYPPGATGATSPVRTIQPDGYPRSLAIDAQHNLVVAVLGTADGNAIETYPPGAHGAAAPIRRIAGPHTGLGVGLGFGGFSGDSVVLTYSALTGRIYAGVSSCATASVPTHLSVFPGTSTGDLAPVRTIQGSATGFGRYQAIDGIAGDPVNGNVFVMHTTCLSGGPQGPGRVSVFGRLASGNTAPLHAFTDATTGFTDVRGIAFAPP